MLVGPPEKAFTRGASNEVVIEVEGNDTEVVIDVDVDSTGSSPSIKQVLYLDQELSSSQDYSQDCSQDNGDVRFAINIIVVVIIRI